MKHVDEYRDGKLARDLARRIAAEARANHAYRFMEFCGGHTHAISRYGVEDLLPANIRMIHGPGCPVCVLPMGRIDDAITLAKRPEVTLCTYGDLMRVPGSNGSSLLKTKAADADIRMVYSTLDAIAIASNEPERQVVFFAIGFETTTPPTAMAIRLAQKKRLTNFTIFCNHVLTPSAIQKILEASDPDAVEIDGFIGPAHVSTIIGTTPYQRFATEFHKPVVVAGFEPLDVVQAILMLVRQVNEGRAEIENQYIRAVSAEGNRRALAEIADIFETRKSFEWRGLGEIPDSALRLRELMRNLTPNGALRSSRGRRATIPPANAAPSARREAPTRLQAIWRGLHAGDADGRLHGVVGGLLRRLLGLRPISRPRDGL